MDKTHGVSGYAGQFLSQVVAGVPKLLGALLILLIGYIVAKVLCKVVGTLLDKVSLDDKLHNGHGGNIVQKAFPYPSHLITRVVFWAVFLFAISVAASALGIPALVALVAGIYAYIPNVIAALLIFLVAGALAGGVAGLVKNTLGDTATGKIVGTAAPVVIMSIAGFMILNQLKIAPAIVTITYAVLLGSAGLGAALAFGLGGRETAGKVVSGLYSKGQASKPQVKQELSVGKRNALRQKELIR